jgi:hypothetical protein
MTGQWNIASTACTGIVLTSLCRRATMTLMTNTVRRNMVMDILHSVEYIEVSRIKRIYGIGVDDFDKRVSWFSVSVNANIDIGRMPLGTWGNSGLSAALEVATRGAHLPKKYGMDVIYPTVRITHKSLVLRVFYECLEGNNAATN